VGEVVIRPAGVEDLPAVLELFDGLNRHQRLWRVFTPREGFATGMAGRLRDALADRDSFLVVATDEDEVVGMAMGQVNRPSSFSDELAVELSSVFVRPSHRRRGLARSLTVEVARFARRLGVRRVTLRTFSQNRGALRAWRRLGFQPRIVQMTALVSDLDPQAGSAGSAEA
jgi:ribosomal protein S18 acetylase RimI-like enzyme